MDFGTAFTHLKAGRTVARAPWTAKGVALLFLPGITFTADTPALIGKFADDKVRVAPYIAYITPHIVIPWEPSQVDVIAEDWEVLPIVSPVAAEVVPNRKARRSVRRKK